MHNCKDIYIMRSKIFFLGLMMKILKLSFLALGMGLSGFAQADFIGVKGDVGYWFYDGKANMSSQSPEDQDLDRKGSAQLSLAFEHPIPFDVC